MRATLGLLKIRGFARIDVRLTPTGEVFLLEVNPNPSLAEDEDFARSAADGGVVYDSLIQEVLNTALV